MLNINALGSSPLFNCHNSAFVISKVIKQIYNKFLGVGVYLEILGEFNFNALNAELNPICYLLALLGAHHFLHVSRIRVKSLTLRPAAAHLLRSWVPIPPGTWIFVCCECRVLSGRGLCDELITRPEESYRLWCVVVCDLETSRVGGPYI